MLGAGLCLEPFEAVGLGEAPYMGVIPAGVVEHESGLGIVVFAGNPFEAVWCQCAGEHASEGVPAVFDGVFSQVIGKIAYAAQGVMVAVQQPSPRVLRLP